MLETGFDLEIGLSRGNIEPVATDSKLTKQYLGVTWVMLWFSQKTGITVKEYHRNIRPAVNKEDNVLQLIIQGRGGQGAQLAGNILAKVFSQEGRHVLVYATYGGARRGTPVTSSLRVDDKPLRMRCDIENPDAIVCFDSSLLTGGNLLSTATEKTLVLINSTRPATEFAHLGSFRIVAVDAIDIARNNQLGRIVNTTLVGTLLGLMNYSDVDLLQRVIGETSPVKAANNVAACMDGYRIGNERGC